MQILMGVHTAADTTSCVSLIGQRTAMFMLRGPKAHKEAQWMVTEKVLAAGQTAATLAAGGTPHKVVRGYRRQVQANHRRLSKS